MTTEAERPLRFDTKNLSQLACPACRGDLTLDGPRLFCAVCNRAYPIVDGIPILIAERTEALRATPES
jgi:uncharacterized protein YbaR (Trm112 family)